MSLALADWLIIITYLALALFIGIRFRGTASKNLEGFFLGGAQPALVYSGSEYGSHHFCCGYPTSSN